MSKTTSQFMRKLRLKLTKLQRLEACACGHESEIQKSVQCRIEIEAMVEDQLLCLENAIIRSGGHVL